MTVSAIMWMWLALGVVAGATLGYLLWGSRPTEYTQGYRDGWETARMFYGKRRQP